MWRGQSKDHRNPSGHPFLPLSLWTLGHFLPSAILFQSLQLVPGASSCVLRTVQGVHSSVPLEALAYLQVHLSADCTA